MKNRKTRGRIAGAALALVLALALALARPGSEARIGAHRAQPLAPEVVGMAVACIGAGEVRPALSELSDGELAGIVEIVGRLIGAYGHGDFDSFLALRAGDVAFASQAQRGHVEELRSFCLELGLPRSDLPGDWNGLLRAYWRAYYVEAPVARFLPEGSIVDLHREGLGARSLASWDRDFEALLEARPGFRLDHRLAIPHRRSMERVAADAGGLAWLDLQLGFEAHDGNRGGLVARFVWDGVLQEWFLRRASTIHDGEPRDDRRHLVL